LVATARFELATPTL